VCLIFALVVASGQGTWVKGSVAPVLASISVGHNTCTIAFFDLDLAVRNDVILEDQFIPGGNVQLQRFSLEQCKIG